LHPRVRERERAFGLGKIVAHEDLADEARTGRAELARDGKRAHEQLEAPRLIGDLVAAGARRHVAQNHVVRREARSPGILGAWRPESTSQPN
jgi:hypothetical protein